MWQYVFIRTALALTACILEVRECKFVYTRNVRLQNTDVSDPMVSRFLMHTNDSQMNHMYGEGSFAFNKFYVWNVIIMNLSQVRHTMDCMPLHLIRFCRPLFLVSLIRTVVPVCCSAGPSGVSSCFTTSLRTSLRPLSHWASSWSSRYSAKLVCRLWDNFSSLG